MLNYIRLRACVAVIQNNKILLVPHYDTDAGPLQWVIPCGGVEFGESLRAAARREFQEETGYEVRLGKILDLSEVIRPEKPWHSITIVFLGRIEAGQLKSEEGHPYGSKLPQWFSADEIAS